MQAQIQQVAEKLAQAKRVVISTGAGVSQESGIPTFRDALTGLWAKYDPQLLATPLAFNDNPKLVWDFYAYRRDVAAQANPNAGHYAIAELERLLPTVLLITQNVDNLHQRAGSQNMLRLHGSLFDFKCSRGCTAAPIDLESLPRWNAEDAPPPCPNCTEGKVRPDVVWFGEPLPAHQLKQAQRESANCDVMLVVGTSGAVYPAAWLPLIAAEHKAFVVEVNPNESDISRAMDVCLRAPSGEALPQVVEALKALLT